MMFGVGINVEDWIDQYGSHHRHVFTSALDGRGRRTLRVHNGIVVQQTRWSDGPHSMFELAAKEESDG